MAMMTKADYQAALMDPWRFVKTEAARMDIGVVQLAEGSGVPRSTVRSYYNGMRARPALGNIRLLVRYILKMRREL